MSKFSGKCDIYDHFGDDDERIQNTRFYIYVDDKLHRLDIHERRDLVPYFAHLVCVSAWSDGHGTCILTSRSYVDMEETEHLQLTLDRMKKHWRRCKRNHTTFDVEECLQETTWRDCSDVETQLAERVRQLGDKATVDGLHESFRDTHYRTMLASEMSQHGYTDKEIQRWVFQNREYNWRAKDL